MCVSTDTKHPGVRCCAYLTWEVSQSSWYCCSFARRDGWGNQVVWMKSCIMTKNAWGTAPLNPWGIWQKIISLHSGSGLSAPAPAHPDTYSSPFCHNSGKVFFFVFFLSFSGLAVSVTHKPSQHNCLWNLSVHMCLCFGRWHVVMFGVEIIIVSNIWLHKEP